VKLNLIVTLSIGFLVGIVAAQQRKPTLLDFVSSKAEITKLDWILLKAELQVMKEPSPSPTWGGQPTPMIVRRIGSLQMSS
jgi:hypothetical protein